jgi:hypothetical protein
MKIKKSSDEVEAAGASDGNGSELRNKIAISPRESVRTVAERLEKLDALPSLLDSTPDTASKITRVDTNSPPPAPIAPPPPEPTASEFIDRGAPIPNHYGMDRIAALPRDPYWVYVYWELKGGILDRLRFQHSAEVIDNSRWVLRVRTPGVERHYLVDIDLRAGQWYLKVAPDSRLRIDLGFMDQHGDFVLVLSANDTATPRPGVSDIVDERWLIVRSELEKLLGAGTDALAILDAVGSSSGPRLARSEKPRAAALFSGTVVRREQNEQN